MKKKLLMMLSIMVVLVCALAISVSAEASDYFGEVEIIDLDNDGVSDIAITDKIPNILEEGTDDKGNKTFASADARVTIKCGCEAGEHTFPAYYVTTTKDGKCFYRFDYAKLNELLPSYCEDAYTVNGTHILAIEVPNGYETIYSGFFYESIDGSTKMAATSLEYFSLAKCSTITYFNATSTGKDWFKGSSIEEANLGIYVTNIPVCCFQNSSLQRITIPDSVVTIGRLSFTGCTSLTTLNISEASQLTTIEAGAFQSCSSLGAFYIPSKITTLGIDGSNQSPFQGCTSMYFVNKPGEEKPDVYYLPSTVTSVIGETFKGCKGLNNVIVFHEGITELTNGWAFSGSNAITLVFLGDMTKISTSGAAWTKQKAIYFCNENDIDSSCYEGASNIASEFIFCKADGNEKHLSSPNAAVKVEADCTTPESTTFKCFCGKEMGTEVTSPALGHTHEDAVAYVSINYNGNYLANGYYVYVCSRCSENYDDETADAPALFTLRGYSHATGAIMQGFAINKEAFDEYVDLTKKDVKYGILAANGALETLHVGSAFVNDVISVDFTNRAYDIMEMKIYGITSATQDTQLYCCGYVMVDGEIIYMDKNMADGELPAKVSYAGLGGTFAQTASLEAVVPTKEEVLA